MTVQVRLEDQTLVIEDEGRLVAGRHYSQLVYWGFKPEPNARRFVCSGLNNFGTLDKVLAYFEKHAIPYSVGAKITEARAELSDLRGLLHSAVLAGATFKDGDLRAAEAPEFLSFLSAQVP